MDELGMGCESPTDPPLCTGVFIEKRSFTHSYLGKGIKAMNEVRISAWSVVAISSIFCCMGIGEGKAATLF